jgi:glucosamine-6-phosphate deaminase
VKGNGGDILMGTAKFVARDELEVQTTEGPQRVKATKGIIVATGTSQFEMLAALVVEEGIDWSKVTGFHLDEYVGLPISHPASFRRFLWQRFVSQLPLPMRHFHFLKVFLTHYSIVI